MSLLGKLEESHVNDMLARMSGAERSNCVQQAAYGVDVSAVAIDHENYLLQCSDPLSYLPQIGLRESAWLSLVLIANDMATTGVAPQFAQLVMNLPADMQESEYQEFWSYIDEYAKKLGIAITGGHTSFIPGYNSTLAGGGTLSSIAKKDLVRFSHMAKPGDLLLMSGCAGKSSSSILAKSFPEIIKAELGEGVQEKVAEMFFQTSVVEVGVLAPQFGGVHAMHDVTEGGVVGASFEMAKAAQLGLDLQVDEIKVDPEIQQVMDVFDLDSRYCIGAGSMLIACAAHQFDELKASFNERGIPLSKIGKFKETTSIVSHKNCEQLELRDPGADPYWMAYFNAVEKGWK